jgi:hypothetical protein
LRSLDAATIDAYESGELDLPVSVLFAYAKLAGIPIENRMMIVICGSGITRIKRLAGEMGAPREDARR